VDGPHDLGGKQGFGPVLRETDEPVFHEPWEATVFGMMLATRWPAGIHQNLDRFRHAIERIVPAAYLTHEYYGRWLGGLEIRLVEAGVLESEEITARALQLGAGADDLIAAQPSDNPDFIPAPPTAPTEARALSRRPRFTLGDRVRTRRHSVPGHTRLPAYARDRVGVVTAWYGGWVYPDSNAHGRGEDPQHLYTVAFDGRELWGDGSEAGIVIHLDLFEPYLQYAAGSSTGEFE